MGQVCCKKDDSELGLEFLRTGWDIDIREDGEWMEPIEKKSRASDEPGGKRNSGLDKVKESVSPKQPSEEWAGWLDVVDNLNKLEVDDLDTSPCPDKKIEDAVNKADFRVGLGVLGNSVKGFLTTSMGSLYSNDSVLMALKESNEVEEEIGEDSSVISNLSFDGDTAEKQAGTKAHSSAASNPQSGNAQPEKLGDGALSPRDLALLIGRMKGGGEVARLISRMKSASEEARLDGANLDDSANWDDSADWGDTDLVAPRPAEDKREARFPRRMSGIAEDREKSWEGGGGIPSENLAEGGENLMYQMEQLGDKLLAEVDGWEDNEDNGGADPGEAGGRREGPHRTRRDTDALFARMDTLNSEFAAEVDNLNKRLTS